MLRQDKERIVGELAERLKSSPNILVADYRGLSMPEIDELRTKLLETGARFSVVKNTLTRLAAEQAGVQALLELIDGPTAIAFIDADGDPAAAAKILNDTARMHDVLVIRGGLLEGDTVGDAEIKQLEEQGETVPEPEAEAEPEEPQAEADAPAEEEPSEETAAGGETPAPESEEE